VLRRLELFLYSRRNIVGSALALGGLALHFIGLVGGPIWLPIVAGLYLIGVLLVPGEKDFALRLDAAEDAAEVREGLDRLLAAVRGKVADDLYAKAVDIRASILATIATDGTTGSGADPNVYLIRQTALSYLPEAFATYLRMPRRFAEHRSVAAGRTPHDVFLDQLQLMDTRLADVADNIAQHDSDKLLANGRFLAEKFAVSSLLLGRATADEPAATTGTKADAVGSNVTEEERVALSADPESAKAIERERVR
jgi:hypothetical protein